jgi:hypothetical protein
MTRFKPCALLQGGLAVRVTRAGDSLPGVKLTDVTMTKAVLVHQLHSGCPVLVSFACHMTQQ